MSHIILFESQTYPTKANFKN